MAKQTIDIGSSPNKGDGDPIRVAFDKINKNFTELYDGNFVDPANINSSLIPQTTETLNLGSTDKKWADLHLSDFLYINGQRIEALPNGSLLVNGNNIVEDTIFGSDGTIADNIIPNANEAYDLGSVTNRFRDLYLSGNTIDLGGTTLSVVGGELQLGGVKVPTTADVAATVASAISAPTGDLTGSVFADDSTLLVDGVSGTIPGTLTGNWTSPGNFFTVSGAGFTVNSTTNTALSISDFGLAFSNSGDDDSIALSISNGSFGLSGDGSFSVSMETFGISVGSIASIIVGSDLGISVGGDVNLAATNINISGTINGTFNGDITGSVFADDSTLLVDAVNGVIPWSVIDGAPSLPTFDQTLDTTDEVAFAAVSVGNLRVAPIGNGVELLNTTNDIIITAQDDFTVSTTTGDINLYTTAGSVGIDAAGGLLQMQGQNGVDISSALGDIELNAFDNNIIFSSPVVGLVGDITGSVFADDSTLLVDGVAGKIRGDIESNTVDITSTVGDVNITAADDIDLTTTDSTGDIRMYSAGDIRFSAATGIDIFDTDSIYAEVTNDIDFIANAGTARLSGNGRLDLISETDQFNIEGVSGSISVETDLIIFTNANTANNPTGTNNNIQLLQNGNIRAEAFQGDIYNDSGDTKLLDASQEELLCDVAFTPDAAGGWDTYWADPKPQTVAEALDRLASAIYTANGGTPV